MKVITRKKPLLEVKQDIIDMYGLDGAKSFLSLCVKSKMNPRFVLSEFYPQLWNAYTEEYQKQIFEEWDKKAINAR